VVCTIPSGVHHRADLWEDPLTYKPERFLDVDENEAGTRGYTPEDWGIPPSPTSRLRAGV